MQIEVLDCGSLGRSPSGDAIHSELAGPFPRHRSRSKGYVVVFVDYLSARGLLNCRGSGAVNAVDRQRRTGRRPLSARTALREASQISAVDWSLGGGAGLAALGQLTAAENSPLLSVVAY